MPDTLPADLEEWAEKIKSMDDPGRREYEKAWFIVEIKKRRKVDVDRAGFRALWVRTISAMPEFDDEPIQPMHRWSRRH